MRIWFALAAAVLVVEASPALAERDKQTGAPFPPGSKREIPSPITDRFYVRGAFYAARISTTLRVDGAGGLTPGTTVNAEQDLGLPSSLNQGRIQLMFRMVERNRLRVDYFQADRSAEAVLNKTIVFGDETFVPGDRAASTLNWRMFSLTYLYSVLRKERVEVGLGAGVYMLEGEAIGAVQARGLRQEVSGAGAFPTIAMDAAWRISSRFALTARAQYLRASFNSFQGALGDYQGDVQYRWRPNFAVGAGYSVLRPSLNISTGSFPGLVGFDVKGPELFFRVSF
jgi:hypothetical protein